MKHLKTLIFCLFITSLGLFFVKVDVIHASTIFTDNFESYTAGELDGQGNWYRTGSTDNAYVESGVVEQGNFAAEINGSGQDNFYRTADEVADGQLTFYFYVSDHQHSRAYIYIGKGAGQALFGFFINNDLNNDVIFEGSSCSGSGGVSDISPNAWHYAQFQWESSDHKGRYNIDGGTWTGWQSSCVNFWNSGGLSTISLAGNNVSGHGAAVYIDNIEENFTPTSPTLTITAPTSGTTITSNSTAIYGSYVALHSGEDGYGLLDIEMRDPNNGLFSQIYQTPLTAGAGSFTFPISTFNITENGEWDLKATQKYLYNGDELDEDLSPTYNLIFNVAGNSAPYTFTDWNTWYLANAAGGYSAPSDFGNSIEGFFQPIFTNVYEFYNNTSQYFNATTAHDKGYAMGQIFPIAQAYLDNIDIFFGGFPLVPVFEFALIVLLGIFIVRTIFKFIPFFG